MANFQFNDEQTGLSRRQQTVKVKGIQGRIIKWGLAKNESQANLIMIGLVIVAFAIIIWQQVDLSSPADQKQIDPAVV
jgi:hypothetical protein